MERLLSRDEGSQRRKSFKTYREIVEDKYTFFFRVVFIDPSSGGIVIIMRVGGTCLVHK